MSRSTQDPSVKITVCFFGITRSLNYTIASINRNVLTPARAAGDVSIYGHFFKQSIIENSRSGEQGRADLEEYRLLHCDEVNLDEPDIWIDPHWRRLLQSFGDHWEDDFRSFRNLLHQLHSLGKVTELAMKGNPDIVVFCRPDLEYHDSLGGALGAATRQAPPAAFVPRWQEWGGLNDRFAICIGRHAIEAYGLRITRALDYVKSRQSPLHAERLLMYSMERSGVTVRSLDARASRVRLGGATHKEDFAVNRLKLFKREMRRFFAGRQ